MMEPCTHCDHVDWCSKRGCTAWNDTSREQYDRMKALAKARNDEIDELERFMKEPAEVTVRRWRTDDWPDRS